MIALALSLTLSVIDGDTLRLGPERIRLSGIDAPELHGCPRTRVCTPGDPVASRDALARMVSTGPVTIQRHGFDRYGRTLAVIWAGRVNVNCALLAGGYAVRRYEQRYLGRCE